MWGVSQKNTQKAVRCGLDKGALRILRSIESFDACYTVLKTMAPQTGHIIVNDLHLSASKTWILIQVQLVFSTILNTKITQITLIQ